jgi:sugar phosphate isomerase/epimerase
MQLSVSCRIAEGFLSKEDASISFEALADMAVAAGYDAICMRASQIGVQSTPDEVRAARRILDERSLNVTMISGDFDIVYNNERGPNCLRNITPYLNLADALGAPMIRVCIKQSEDIIHVQNAADAAAQRGLKIVHQCHVQSLFETLDEIEARVREINRPNFGLVFEAANLEQCGQDYGPPAIERLTPWIENVYLQNQRISATGAIRLNTWCNGPVPIDLCEIYEPDGIDFASVFEGLQAIGYDGPLTVHQSAPEDTSLTALDTATQTATFLRQLMSDNT